MLGNKKWLHAVNLYQRKKTYVLRLLKIHYRVQDDEKQELHWYYPPPLVLTRARLSKSAETQGRDVWTTVCLCVTHTMQHILQT